MVTNKVNILLCDENINEEKFELCPHKKHKDYFIHSHSHNIEECPNFHFTLYFQQWNFYGWFLRFLEFYIITQHISTHNT